MEILIALDDTGNDPGHHTGNVLEALGEMLRQEGLTGPGRITVHPLLQGEGLAPVGGNRAYCLGITAVDAGIGRLTELARTYVEEHHLPGAFPGLCLVLTELLDDRDRLINFAYKCLKNIVTVEEAQLLAERLEGVFLSAHGPEGQGVIGALAAAAFRLEGRRGFFLGPVELLLDPAEDETILSVGELLDVAGIDLVLHAEGAELDLEDRILLTAEPVLYLHGNRAVLWVSGGGEGPLKVVTGDPANPGPANRNPGLS